MCVVTAPTELILKYSYARRLYLCVFYLNFFSKVRDSVRTVVVNMMEGVLVKVEGYMKLMLQSHKYARIRGFILLRAFISVSSSWSI